jgi:hypothetical protein
MELTEIRHLFELPALRILRGSNAALVLAFLHRAFKRQPRVAIPESELQAALEAFLEPLRDAEVMTGEAASYLTSWLDSSHGFLSKYYGEDSEPLYELTSGAEKALIFLESLRRNNFVGTESRLQSIFNGLEEILKFSSGDADERIGRLTHEVNHTIAEIDRIRATGEVKTFTPVEINERFAMIVKTARELLGDFRLVEENFKSIARDIAEKHANPGVTKGAIVGGMLSAHDALRESDQGQSFFAFWELLIAEERRSKFESNLKRVSALEALDARLRDDRLLARLISHLLIEGEQVASSHQRLSMNLRRVLDSTHLNDRRRMFDLVREIQAVALTVKDVPAIADKFYEMQETPDAYSGMSRPLWHPSEALIESGPVELAEGELGLDELRRFRNLPQIRLQVLRRNVEQCLERRPTVVLEEVLDQFPAENGVTEVLGYLILASRERRHFISDELLAITLGERHPQRWRVPLVMFCRE